MTSHSIIFFAGGSKGPNSRGDGNGGHMPRGWYVRATKMGTFGPFATLTEARRHPQNRSDIVEPKLTIAALEKMEAKLREQSISKATGGAA